VGGGVLVGIHRAAPPPPRGVCLPSYPSERPKAAPYFPWGPPADGISSDVTAQRPYKEHKYYYVVAS
jgi:hypothetical protein